MANVEGPTGTQGQMRDYLANERTLLSWIRLGVAVSAFGFVVARFGLFLQELSRIAPESHAQALTQWVGVGLVLLGPVLAILAAVRFFKTEQDIRQGRLTRSYGLIVSVVATSVLVSVGLAAYLLLSSRASGGRG